MNLHTTINQNSSVVIGQIGWKYYNTIKKKAMEQEFSWSGLLISLSIAFFIVVMAALTLNFFYQSLQEADLGFVDVNLNSELPDLLKMDDSLKIRYYEKMEEIQANTNLFV